MLNIFGRNSSVLRLTKLIKKDKNPPPPKKEADKK